MGIPADAPNKDGAHALLNFVLDPANMTGITAKVQYGNAVPATLATLDDAVKTNPAVFPTEAQKAKLFSIKSVKSSTERLRTRLWTKIKTGK